MCAELGTVRHVDKIRLWIKHIFVVLNNFTNHSYLKNITALYYLCLVKYCHCHFRCCDNNESNRIESFRPYPQSIFND